MPETREPADECSSSGDCAVQASKSLVFVPEKKREALARWPAVPLWNGIVVIAGRTACDKMSSCAASSSCLKEREDGSSERLSPVGGSNVVLGRGSPCPKLDQVAVSSEPRRSHAAVRRDAFRRGADEAARVNVGRLRVRHELTPSVGESLAPLVML